jgi:hypothetical protein
MYVEISLAVFAKSMLVSGDVNWGASQSASSYHFLRHGEAGCPFNDLAVARNSLTGIDHHAVAWLESAGVNFLNLCATQPTGGSLPPCFAQRLGLGLAASLSQRGGEIGKQHGQEQPDV